MDPLSDRSNLIPGFHNFLPGGYRNSFPRDHSRRRETDSQRRRSHRTESLERVIAFVNKLRARFWGNDRLYVSFLETICAHPEEDDAVLKKVAPLLRHHPDILREFHRLAAARPLTAQTTAKREAAATWRWEDERHEMDLIGQYLTAAAHQANQLSAAITLGRYVEEKNGIEEYFSAHNLVMIQRMYGRHGVEFMAALRRDPAPAIRLILHRLEQKRVEWEECSAGFRKIDQL